MPPTATLTVENVLMILRRRIWLLPVTLALVSAATAVGVLRLPNRYRSDTLILVVPQRVSGELRQVDRYVEDRGSAAIEHLMFQPRTFRSHHVH
jgi:uncharacterized protein involved in exopolysaccharide biosynthesis